MYVDNRPTAPHGLRPLPGPGRTVTVFFSSASTPARPQLRPQALTLTRPLLLSTSALSPGNPTSLLHGLSTLARPLLRRPQQLSPAFGNSPGLNFLRPSQLARAQLQAPVYPRQSNPRRSKPERCTRAYYGLDDFYAARQASRFRPATA